MVIRVRLWACLLFCILLYGCLTLGSLKGEFDVQVSEEIDVEAVKP